MKEQRDIDSLWVEREEPPKGASLNVAEWLSDIESAVGDADVPPDREYTNIGGKNGLELFV